MQGAGALLFLIPRWSSQRPVLAGSTMVGAVSVHLFVLDTGVGGRQLSRSPAAFSSSGGVCAGRRSAYRGLQDLLGLVAVRRGTPDRVVALRQEAERSGSYSAVGLRRATGFRTG